MRVLHVIASLSAVHGGPPAAIWTTVRALQARGVAIDIATTDDDGTHRLDDVRHGQFVRANGANICYFPRQTRKYTTSLPLFSWLSRRARDYDVIHAHGLFTFAPLAAAYAAQMRGVPYVMCPHGTLNRWARSSRSKWPKRASFSMLEGPLLARAARVHFTTQSELQEASEVAPMNNGAVIPFAIDLPKSQGYDGTRDASGLSESDRERPIVLFLARIHPVKGLELLLEAFASVRKRCPNALLAIAGDGTADYVAKLVHLSTALGVGEHVRWLGFVTGARKLALMRCASVFVLPSWSENFSYSVAEALEARVPVVVTSTVGIADLVERGAAGFIVDRSPERMADAICSLLLDPSLRIRMGEAGHRLARRELSMETFGARLESLYSEVLRA